MGSRGRINDLKDLDMGPSRSPSPGSRLRDLARNMSWSPSRRTRVRGDSTASRPDDSTAYAHVPLPWFLRQSKADRCTTFVELEWQQRNRLSAGATAADLTARWARTSTLPDTALRNRYANIEPFANNRVKLKVGEGENDYINASPIVLGNRRYISTQGPKESSVTHFYRMLASDTSAVAVIIMLTQTHEAGREKCFSYWPTQQTRPSLELLADEPETETEVDENGNSISSASPPNLFQGSVSLISTEKDRDARTDISHLQLRTRNMSPTGEPLEDWQAKDVYHLHFAGWPDFSVPEGADRQALLSLLRLSRKLNAHAPAPKHSSFPGASADEASTSADKERGVTATESRKTSEGSAVDVGGDVERNPRIVHCSAGVGRSGTFIALDYLVGKLEAGELDDVAEGTDPIAEVVNRLREQRMMMVQGEGQFHFLYEMMRELWTERWTAANCGWEGGEESLITFGHGRC